MVLFADKTVIHAVALCEYACVLKGAVYKYHLPFLPFAYLLEPVISKAPFTSRNSTDLN